MDRKISPLNWILVLTLLCCDPRFVLAQPQDSFEGGSPRWQFGESDCNAQLTSQEISLTYPHAGQSCEQIEVAAGNGTMALIAYPIEPCTIIDEFRPRIWAVCSSSGLRVGLRVVFPLAEHPVTGGRLTTILWGESYSQPGQWQALQVDQIEKKFQAELVVLRQRYGSNLKLESAVVDSVVMNIYTGPGRYRVQLDDLSLPGLVSLPSIGQSIPVNWREQWRWRFPTTSPEARFWNAGNRPEVWLQHQGESLEWLKSLGVTGLTLPRLPTEEQLAAIFTAEMTLVSPPPAYDIVFDSQHSKAIRGWLIGSGLDSNQIALARENATKAAHLSASLRRPLFGESLENYWDFSRIVDHVIVPAPDVISPGNTSEHIAWMASQFQATAQQSTAFVSLNAGPDPLWLNQFRQAQRIIEPERDEVPVDALGLRHQMFDSIMSGARGIALRSPVPLNIYNESSRAQAAALRWTNHDLEVCGPWIVAGTRQSPPTLSRPDFRAVSWMIDQSQLVVIKSIDSAMQSAATNQAVPTIDGSAIPSSLLHCDFLVRSTSRQLFRLTRGSMERVQVEAEGNRMRWSVTDPAPVEIFVATESPEVTNFLSRKLTQFRLTNAEDQLEVAAYQHKIASEIFAVRFRDPTTAEAKAVLQLQNQARQKLERGYQELRNNRLPEATDNAIQSTLISQRMIDDATLVAVSNLASRQSSPFVLNPVALKYHWMLADACNRSAWRELPIAGANFENLDSMLQAGWSQQQRLKEQAEVRVEWIPPQASQAPALRLAAYQKENSRLPGGYEGASLRIRSAAAIVKPGQLVRIQARAQIRNASNELASGLLVYDNQAGPAMGQLVRGNPGEVREVELYRFVSEDGELRVLAECRGACDILLDSLRASVIEPATNRSNHPTGFEIPAQRATEGVP